MIKAVVIPTVAYLAGPGDGHVCIDPVFVLDLSSIVNPSTATYYFSDLEGNEVPITEENVHNVEVRLTGTIVATNPDAS